MVLALQGLACAAAAWGDSRRAARLFGAGEALARAQGQAPLPAECTLTLPYVQAARKALDARSFAAAWAAGMRLTVEAASALALEEEWRAARESSPDWPAPAEVWHAASDPPPQPVLLVDRQQEHAALQSYLDSPEARLITVVGPGGT
jgi:hypothetical protein